MITNTDLLAVIIALFAASIALFLAIVIIANLANLNRKLKTKVTIQAAQIAEMLGLD